MSSDELMQMNWQEMITPENILVTGTQSYGKFVCEPLERGFGITIGNALRRIILSSLHGTAIVSVKFENVMHEFTTIPGVVEDVTEIILNLKSVRLRNSRAEVTELYIDKEGAGTVTAGDIQCNDGNYEVLNPELHIATLSENAQLKMTMTVKVGKGYSLAEANKDENMPVGAISIDAVFSPIKRVIYVVGNARVGQRTDYDKLTLEVWTDGSILPVDAVAYAAKILKEQLSLFINFDEDAIPEPEVQTDKVEKPVFNENLYRTVDELELSVRSANCLKNANILKIWQLVSKTEQEMLKTKNFGRKSLNEMKEVLSEMGLSLSMKLEGFVPREEDTDQGE